MVVSKSEFPSFGVRFPPKKEVMSPAIFFDEPGICENTPRTSTGTPVKGGVPRLVSGLAWVRPLYRYM